VARALEVNFLDKARLLTEAIESDVVKETCASHRRELPNELLVDVRKAVVGFFRMHGDEELGLELAKHVVVARHYIDHSRWAVAADWQFTGLGDTEDGEWEILVK
jgi:hypothetical protein